MVWFLWNDVILHFANAGQNYRFMLISSSLASPFASDGAWLISKYQHGHLRGRGRGHMLLHTQRYWIFSSFLVAKQSSSGVNEKCVLLGRDLKWNLLLCPAWAPLFRAPLDCATVAFVMGHWMAKCSKHMQHKHFELHSDPWILKTGSWAERVLLSTHTNKA